MTAALVALFLGLMITLMVWSIRAMKRRGRGDGVAAAIFHGVSQGLDGPAQYVETVKDPERRRLPGAEDTPKL